MVSPAARAADVLLSLYQRTLSPDHGWGRFLAPGAGCRFQPTCSSYARSAIAKFGLLRGSLLALRRLGRCHPFAASAYDPVPHA